MEEKECSNGYIFDLLQKYEFLYTRNSYELLMLFISSEDASIFENYKVLDLRNTRISPPTDIVVMPESIGLLINLETLELGGLRIQSLPASISRLKKLQKLSMGGTTISELPTSIGELDSLLTLNISGTPIRSLPILIGRLKNLQKLIMCGSSVSALPETIGQLENLQSLDLSGTEIRILPETIGQLNNLQKLVVSRTGITTLPESIGQLTNLRSLELSGTKVSSLPKSIGKLKALQTLYLRKTDLLTLPETISQLNNLHKMILRGSRITYLPEAVGYLPALRYLDISNTSIKSLPVSLALGKFKITGDTQTRDYFVKSHKPVIFAKNTKLPSEYFAEKEVLARFLGRESKGSFQEAKVIFLGDGNAGKTYTINRMMKGGEKESEQTGPYSEGQTHGVKPYDLTCKGDFTLHLWDFGGQEMLHAMHRCFLTENTVYVIMISTRASEHDRRLRYWLNSILPYFPRSIVVQDKDERKSTSEKPLVTVIINVFDDDGEADFDELQLRYEYRDRLDLRFVKISVKDAEPTCFKESIIKPLMSQATETDAATHLWPVSYLRIRDDIKKELKKPDPETGLEVGWLKAGTYLRLCEEQKITNETEQTALLRYFTQLGICFSTIGREDSAVPKDCRIIQPVWMTNAIYAVIEECQAVNGQVAMDYIRLCLAGEPGAGKSPGYLRVDPDRRYNEEDCDYILRVAEQYDLAYRDQEDMETVFVPAMCRSGEKPEPAELTEVPPARVVYEIEYIHLPDATVHRLMVGCLRMGMKLKRCWRGGFLAEGRNCVALVDTIRDGTVLRFDLQSTADKHPIKDLFEDYRKLLRVDEAERGSLREFIVRDRERYPVRLLLHSVRNGIANVAAEYEATTQYSVTELLGDLPQRMAAEYGIKGQLPPQNVTYIHNDRGQMIFNISAAIQSAQDGCKTDVTWERFAANYKNTRIEFEHLCADLFRLEFFDRNTVFQKDPNNPGIEIHPIVCGKGPNIGKHISFQSKYIESRTSLYEQIRESAEKTVKYYTGQLDVLYLYTNQTLTVENLKKTKELLNTAGIALEIVAESELLNRIKDHSILAERYFYV